MGACRDILEGGSLPTGGSRIRTLWRAGDRGKSDRGIPGASNVLTEAHRIDPNRRPTPSGEMETAREDESAIASPRFTGRNAA